MVSRLKKKIIPLAAGLMLTAGAVKAGQTSPALEQTVNSCSVEAPCVIDDYLQIPVPEKKVGTTTLIQRNSDGSYSTTKIGVHRSDATADRKSRVLETDVNYLDADDTASFDLCPGDQVEVWSPTGTAQDGGYFKSWLPPNRNKDPVIREIGQFDHLGDGRRFAVISHDELASRDMPSANLTYNAAWFCDDNSDKFCASNAFDIIVNRNVECAVDEHKTIYADPIIQEKIVPEYIKNPVSQCNDGIDNDGDGLIDYPADPHCKSLNDNSEKKKWYAFWKKKYPMGKPGIVETPIASVPASDAITKEPPEQPIVISENDDSIIDDKGSLKVYMRASKGTDNIKFVPTDSQYANLNKSFDTSATKVGVLVEKPHFLAEGSVKFTNGRESLYDRYGFLGEGESVLGAAGEITYRPWGPFAASVGLQYINQTLYSQFGITRFNKHSQTAMMFDPCVGIGTAFHKPTYFLLQGCATMQSNHDVMPGYAGSDYEFTPNAKLKFRIGNNRFGLLGDLRYGPEDRTVWTNNDLYLARDSSFMNGSLLLDARIGKNWGIQAGGQFSNVDSTFELGPNLDPDLYKDFAGDGSHTTAEAVAGVYFKFK